jgi:hypothetical protein
MNFLFAYLFLGMGVVASSILRKESAPELKLTKIQRPNRAFSKGIETQNIVGGNFPSNPKYVSLVFYDNDDTCTKLTWASTYLADTCFTNGATSQKFTCSKYTNFFCVLNFSFGFTQMEILPRSCDIRTPLVTVLQ